MKTLLATIALMMAFSAQADTTKQGVEYCTSFANIVEDIARLHQGGFDLTYLLNELPVIVHKITIEIYSNNTRYDSQEHQDGAVADTKNLAMINCLKIHK